MSEPTRSSQHPDRQHPDDQHPDGQRRDDQHPDADQLNASALPTRPGWFAGLFSGWNLLWVAAPVFAALVILTIHIRNLHTGEHRLGPIAESHAPVLPPRNTPPAHPGASLVEKATPAAPIAPKAKPRASLKPNAVVDLASSGHNIVQLKPRTAESIQAVGGPVPVHGGVAAFTNEETGAMGLPSKAPVGSAKDLPPLPRSAPAPQPAGMTATSVARQPIQAPDLPPQASATMTINAQNQQLDSAIAPEQMPMNLSVQETALQPPQTPLPSGQPVLSIATNLHRRLALDTRHQFFLSDDDGQHWKSVTAPWPGRALRVVNVSTTLQPRMVPPPALALAVPERFTRGATASAQPEVERVSTVSGAVTGPTGAVIPNATVIATDSHTTFVRSVQTDLTGRYVVEELPPGVYRLEAHAAGFQAQSQTAVVAPAQQSIKNLVLAVGKSTQAVTVEPASSQLEDSSGNAPAAAAKAHTAVSANPNPGIATVFIITTDTGDRWTSPDGQIWVHE